VDAAGYFEELWNSRHVDEPPVSGIAQERIAVQVEDLYLAGELEANMKDNLRNAWRIGENGKPVGYEKAYPEVGLGKRIKFYLVRLILPFIRGQL
jgi:hypothetical protein